MNMYGKLTYLKEITIDGNKIYSYKYKTSNNNSYEIYSDVLVHNGSIYDEYIENYLLDKLKGKNASSVVYIYKKDLDEYINKNNAVNGATNNLNAANNYTNQNHAITNTGGSGGADMPIDITKEGLLNFDRAREILNNLNNSAKAYGGDAINGVSISDIQSAIDGVPSKYGSISSLASKCLTMLTGANNINEILNKYATVINEQYEYLKEIVEEKYGEQIDSDQILPDIDARRKTETLEEFYERFKSDYHTIFDGFNFATFGEFFEKFDNFYIGYTHYSNSEIREILEMTAPSENNGNLSSEEQNMYQIREQILEMLGLQFGLKGADLTDFVTKNIEDLSAAIEESNIILGANEQKFTELMYSIENTFYSSETGQEYLLNRITQQTGAIHDEKNAIGITEYIKYCIERGKTAEWLRNDLIPVSDIITKINADEFFMSEPSELTDLTTIKQYESMGYLPYNVYKKGDKYFVRNYSSLGEQMLYYMDYHWGEENGNNGADKVITAFSNQGYIDAVERNYKGAWVNDRINALRNEITNVSTQELRNIAINDYNILNGLTVDNNRYKELTETEGYISFKDVSKFIQLTGDDTANYLDINYINSNKEKIMNELNLSESQWLNLCANAANTGSIELDALITTGTSAIIAVGQLISGLAKFGENLEDAVNMAVHSDFFMGLSLGLDENGNVLVNYDFDSIKELKDNYNNMCNDFWNKYYNSELYTQEYNNFINSESARNAAIKQFNQIYYNKQTGLYNVPGGLYFSIEQIPDEFLNKYIDSVLPTMFKDSKYIEWSLDDSSSSSQYLATFKEGIRNGGNFDLFDEYKENDVFYSNAKEQFDTMEFVAVDRVGDYLNNYIYNTDLYKAIEELSIVKKDNILGLTVNQIGNMAVPVALSQIPVVGQFLSSGLLFASAFGGASEEAINSGGSFNQAINYATLSATTEILIEKAFSGIGGFGEGWLDDALKYIPDKLISKYGSDTNLLAQVVKEMVVGGIGEGIEEVATDLVTPLWQSLTYMNEKSYNDILNENVSLETLSQTFLVSFLSSMVFKTSEINVKKDQFNKINDSLTTQINNLILNNPNAKELSSLYEEKLNEVMAQWIGGVIDNNDICKNGTFEQMINNISNEISKSEKGNELLTELQNTLIDVKNREFILEIGPKKVNISFKTLMQLEDITGYKGEYTLQDGKIIFENETAKNKFLNSFYNLVEKQYQQNNTAIATTIEELLKSKDKGTNLQNAVDVIIANDKKTTISDYDKSGTVKFVVDGKEYTIPALLAKKIDADGIKILENGTIEFTKKMTGNEYLDKIYDKAIKVYQEIKNKNIYDINKMNPVTKNDNGMVELVNKGQIYINTSFQSNLEYVVTSSTKVEDADLIKQEITFENNGTTEKINIYLDSKNDSKLYNNNSVKDKILEIIKESKKQNPKSNDVYIGEVEINKENDTVEISQNADNKNYVDAVNTTLLGASYVVQSIKTNTNSSTNIVTNNKSTTNINKKTDKNENITKEKNIDITIDVSEIFTAKKAKIELDKFISTLEKQVNNFVSKNKNNSEFSKQLENLKSDKNLEFNEKLTELSNKISTSYNEIIGKINKQISELSENDSRIEKLKYELEKYIEQREKELQLLKEYDSSKFNSIFSEINPEENINNFGDIINTLSTTEIFNRAKEQIDLFIENMKNEYQRFISIANNSKESIDKFIKAQKEKYNAKIEQIRESLKETYQKEIKSIDDKISKSKENNTLIEKLNSIKSELTTKYNEQIEAIIKTSNAKFDALVNSITSSIKNVNFDGLNTVNETLGTTTQNIRNSVRNAYNNLNPNTTVNRFASKIHTLSQILSDTNVKEIVDSYVKTIETTKDIKVLEELIEKLDSKLTEKQKQKLVSTLEEIGSFVNHYGISGENLNKFYSAITMEEKPSKVINKKITAERLAKLKDKKSVVKNIAIAGIVSYTTDPIALLVYDQMYRYVEVRKQTGTATENTKLGKLLESRLGKFINSKIETMKNNSSSVISDNNDAISETNNENADIIDDNDVSYDVDFIKVSGIDINVDNFLKQENILQIIKAGEYNGVRIEKILSELSKTGKLDSKLESIAKTAKTLKKQEIIFNIEEMYSNDNVEPLILNKDIFSALNENEKIILKQISYQDGVIRYLNNNSLNSIRRIFNSHEIDSNNKYINIVKEILKYNQKSSQILFNVNEIVFNNQKPVFIDGMISTGTGYIDTKEIIDFINSRSVNSNYSYYDYIAATNSLQEMLSKKGYNLKINTQLQNEISVYKGIKNKVNFEQEIVNFEEIIQNPNIKPIILPKTISDVSSSIVYKYLKDSNLLNQFIYNVNTTNDYRIISALKNMVMLKNNYGISINDNTIKVIDKLYNEYIQEIVKINEEKLPSIYEIFKSENQIYSSIDSIIKSLESKGYKPLDIIEGILSQATLVSDYNSSRTLYNKAYNYLISKNYEKMNAAKELAKIYINLINLRGFDQVITNEGITINIQKGINWNNQAYTIDHILSELSNIKKLYKTNIPVEMYIYDTFNPEDKYWEIKYDSKDFCSAATGGGNIINIYYNDHISGNTLSHEYGHLLDTQIQSDYGLNNRIAETQEWINAIRNDGNYPSGYAKTNSIEDFAESFAEMYLNPKRFKNDYPNRYNVLIKYINTNQSVHTSQNVIIENVINTLINKYGKEAAFNRIKEYISTSNSNLITRDNNARHLIEQVDINYLNKYISNKFNFRPISINENIKSMPISRDELTDENTQVNSDNSSSNSNTEKLEVFGLEEEIQMIDVGDERAVDRNLSMSDHQNNNTVTENKKYKPSPEKKREARVKHGVEPVNKLSELLRDYSKIESIVKDNDIKLAQSIINVINDLYGNYTGNDRVNNIKRVLSRLDGRTILNIDGFIYSNENPVMIGQELYEKYKDDINTLIEITKTPNTLISYLANPNYEILERLKNGLFSDSAFNSNITHTISKLASIAQNILDGNSLVNPISYVTNVNVEPIFINSNVVRRFNSSNNIKISELYTFISSKNDIYKLLEKELINGKDVTDYKIACELLSQISKDEGYTDNVIEEINEILNVLNRRISVNKKYDLISDIHLKYNEPKSHSEFSNLVKKYENIKKVISKLETIGYSNTEISNALLYETTRITDLESSRRLYYETFNYLVKAGMSKKDASILIREQLQNILDLRGTRVVTKTPSGVEIRVVNNFNSNNELLDTSNIKEILIEAENYYRESGLKEIIIYDTYSPKNLFNEVVQYKDFMQKYGGIFKSQATAGEASITIWADFSNNDTIIHEYAHMVDRDLQNKLNLKKRLSTSKEWIIAMKLDSLNTNQNISEYATSKSVEDFAEFLRVFHNDPINTITLYPNRYKVMSKYINLEISDSLLEELINSNNQLISLNIASIMFSNNDKNALLKAYLFGERGKISNNQFINKVIESFDKTYKNKLDILDMIDAHDIFENMKESLNLNNHELLNIINDYLKGKNILNDVKSYDNLELIKLLDVSDVKDYYNDLINRVMNDETDILDENIYQDILENYYDTEELIASRRKIVSMNNIPNTFNGINTGSIISVLEGRKVIKLGENYIKVKKGILDFISYLNKNNINIRTNRNAQEIIDVLSNLTSSMNVLNFNDVLNGEYPIIVPKEIRIGEYVIETDKIIEYLNNYSNNINSILEENNPVEVADTILKIVSKLAERNPIILDKYSKSIKSIENIKNSYVYRVNGKTYFIPNTFNGIGLEDILNQKSYEDIMRFINSLTSKEKTKYIKALQLFKEYVLNNQIPISSDIIENIEELSSILNSDFSPNGLIKGKLYNMFEMSYRNNGSFGSNQGQVRMIIEHVGVKNAIDMIFGNEIDKRIFLEKLKKTNISEKSFINALLNNNSSIIKDKSLELYSDLIEQVKSTYKNMTTMEAVRFLYLIETEEAGKIGICNNPIALNLIFDNYLGREKDFERDFGYPMFIQINGKMVLNDGRLLVDLFSIINDGILVKNKNGVYNINTSTKDYARIYDMYGFKRDVLQKFLDKKNIKLNLTRTFEYNSSDTLVHYDYLMNRIKNELEQGNYIVFTGRGFDMYVESEPDYRKDIKGHTTTIVGITNDGKLIVDSWGRKSYIDLRKELSRVNEIFEYSTDDGIKKEKRIFTIYSYKTKGK